MRPLALTVLYVGAALLVLLGLVLMAGLALYGLADLAVILWSKL